MTIIAQTLALIVSGHSIHDSCSFAILHITRTLTFGFPIISDTVSRQQHIIYLARLMAVCRE